MKTAGQIAYEEDCKRKPTYDHGVRRKTWTQLGDVERYSWEKNPTPRDWKPLLKWQLPMSKKED